MFKSLSSSLMLFVLTLVICCVLYPFVLWGIGQLVFPDRAAGSMVAKDDKTVGSSLIAQSFSDAKYFQSRPSSAGYDAMASGGSNWGPSNVLLRNRVTRLLGTNGRYKHGKPVGPDIDAWFAKHPNAAAVWAKTYPIVAADWIKGEPARAEYVTKWPSYGELVKKWREDNHKTDADKPNPEDLAVDFMASFNEKHPGKWPAVKEEKDAAGNTVKSIVLATADDDIQSTFFETWFQETHPDMEKVPADLVLASGSGLDPHITLRNAHYQAPRVAEARAALHKMPEVRIRETIDRLIEDHAFTPMWGLAGGDRLVNVLELNLALDEALKGQ